MKASGFWRPNQEERLAFWRDCYALSAFRDVHRYISRWEALNPADKCLGQALQTAIIVSYSNPFKLKEIRLEKAIIPRQFKPTHAEIIGLRDKVIAHRDQKGPPPEVGISSMKSG